MVMMMMMMVMMVMVMIMMMIKITMILKQSLDYNDIFSYKIMIMILMKIWMKIKLKMMMKMLMKMMIIMEITVKIVQSSYCAGDQLTIADFSILASVTQLEGMDYRITSYPSVSYHVLSNSFHISYHYHRVISHHILTFFCAK